MVHYYIELALYTVLAYLAGCTLGAAYRTLFGTDSVPAHQPAVPAYTQPLEKTVVNPVSSFNQPADSNIKTSIRRPAPVLPPTHPSLPRMDVETRMTRPHALPTARGGKADDLKQIKGIGPKNEKILHNLGIYHFDQIAAWKPEQVSWVDDHLQFDGRIEREEWIEQARLLAAGDSSEFSRLYSADGNATGQPKGLAAARNGQPDSLQRISGIGPKNERILHELGIFHFDQIASWTAREITWVDGHLRFNGRIAREEWTRQAKLLADGNEKEFLRLYGTGGIKDASGQTQSGTRTRG